MNLEEPIITTTKNVMVALCNLYNVCEKYNEQFLMENMHLNSKTYTLSLCIRLTGWSREKAKEFCEKNIWFGQEEIKE